MKALILLVALLGREPIVLHSDTQVRGNEIKKGEIEIVITENTLRINDHTFNIYSVRETKRSKVYYSSELSFHFSNKGIMKVIDENGIKQITILNIKQTEK